MARMDDSQDRRRILERLRDDLVALERQYTPQPIGEIAPCGALVRARLGDVPEVPP